MGSSTSIRDQVPPELLDLSAEINRQPRSTRERMQPLCDKVLYIVRLQNRLVRIAQEAIDQLQLDVKYLSFDLEVTRRERDALQEELENS